MSTRSDLLYVKDSDWYLYQELIDGTIHLEISKDDVELNIVIGSITDIRGKLIVGPGFEKLINLEVKDEKRAELLAENKILREEIQSLQGLVTSYDETAAALRNSNNELRQALAKMMKERN